MEIKSQHFKEIGSTNTFAKEHICEFDQNALTVISADKQTSGRGRFQRPWISPIGNLFATFVFFREKMRDDIGNIPQILSLAGLFTLEKYGLKASLKWPNDLVIEDKKLGGILVEVVSCEKSFGIIAGIGINLNLSDDDKEKIDRKATSVYEEIGKTLEATKVLATLTSQFEKNLTLFQKSGFSPFFESFCSKLIHKKGDLLTLSTFYSKIKGNFVSIDLQGGLRLEITPGNIETFTTGELL